jgi:hypothetical protein
MPVPEEPRFSHEKTDFGRFIFMCTNLEAMRPGVGAGEKEQRDRLFDIPLAWCVDHFGPPGNVVQDPETIWHHTARCIIFIGPDGERNATAFRFRWGA